MMWQILFGLLVIAVFILVVWAGSTLKAEYHQEAEKKKKIEEEDAGYR